MQFFVTDNEGRLIPQYDRISEKRTIRIKNAVPFGIAEEDTILSLPSAIIRSSMLFKDGIIFLVKMVLKYSIKFS